MFPLQPQSKIPTVSRSPVTKSPVVHPLYVQLLTKCYSRNSFVLKMIHFDGVYHLPGHALHIFAFSRNATLLFSIDCALFCTVLQTRRTQLFSFQSIPHSLQKTPRGWHVLKENRLAVVALRDAADVFAEFHQPLIVGTVKLFQWRNFFLKLQARCSSRQGCDGGSCCEPGARLPRNLAAPFLAPSLHPRAHRERLGKFLQ